MLQEGTVLQEATKIGYGLDDIKVSIGEAAKIIGVAAHTIRYWEKEFDFYLSATRTNGRQRRYDESALGKLKKVYSMLKNDGYSIAGAKRALYLEMQKNSAAANEEPQVQSGIRSNRTNAQLADQIAEMVKDEVLQKLMVNAGS